MEQYNQQTIKQTEYTVTSRGFMFKHQDVTYYVDRTNLSKEEDIKLMEDILYSKQALIDASADKYQTQFGKLPDQNAALKISIFINETNKEVKHIFYEYNGNQGDDSFLNPSLISRIDREEKTEILADKASIEDSWLFDLVDGIGNSAFSKIGSAINATIDYADSAFSETESAFDSASVTIEPNTNPLINSGVILGSVEKEEATAHSDDEYQDKTNKDMPEKNPGKVIQDADVSVNSEELAADTTEHNAPEQLKSMEDEGSDNKENSAVDGSVNPEELSVDIAEHNAPAQLQDMEGEGSNNTDAPSFFSIFFSAIGNFFSSIFSFIFGSEEKEEDQQPLQMSDPLDSNVEEEEEDQQPAHNDAPSDESESEAIEKLAMQQGQNADEVDDSTFLISSIFSTIGSYLGLSKMGSYLSSIFSSDDKEKDAQLQSEKNLPSYASPLDIPADLDVPTNTDSSGM